jgi:hypothetical protein
MTMHVVGGDPADPFRQFRAYGYDVRIYPAPIGEGWEAEIQGQHQPFATRAEAVVAALDWCHANALED